MAGAMQRKKWAVFLDRDGVINRKAPEGAYITSVSELELLSGVREAIARLNRLGVPVVVITNQRGVARGLMTRADLEDVHREIEKELALGSAEIDAFYSCTHDKQESCGCRKPAPGNLIAASQDLQVDLEHSWMVGDRESDIEAGSAAGCRTIRLTKTSEQPDDLARTKADYCEPDLEAAVELILNLSRDVLGEER